MVDFVALVTPPKLVGPDMKPANGDIYVRSTNNVHKSGVIVVPFQAHGKIVEGEFRALNDEPLMLVVTPEGVALEIFADIIQQGPTGRRDKYSIRRTVSTPDQSTVTWDELVDVVPVGTGTDYVVPQWVTDLLTEAAAAAGPAVAAKVAAEDAASRAETAAASVPSEAELAATIVTEAGTSGSPLNTAIGAQIEQAIGEIPVGGGTVDIPSATGTVNGLSLLADSTGRGTYTGDSERGIMGASTKANGMTWLTWAAMLSNGRIAKGVNASVIGNTLAQMAARMQSDVINHPARIGTPVAVCSGYNDAYEGVSTAAYMATFAEIHAKLKAAQIEMIACTPLPTANNLALRDQIAAYAEAIRAYAAAHGLFVLDLHALTVHTDGGLKPSIKTDGDGVHPGAAGQAELGRLVLAALKNRLNRHAVNPANDWGSLGNLTPNRTFEGALTEGRPPSVFTYGTAVAGAVPSVVAGSEFMDGDWFTVTHTATTAIATYAQRITPVAGRVEPGDVLAITGLARVTGGIELSVGPEWTAAPYDEKAIQTVKASYGRVDYYAEFTAPANFSAPYLDIMLNSGPGTGTAAFAQLGVYNLTKSQRIA